METRLCKLLNVEGMKHFILYEFMETRLCKLLNAEGIKGTMKIHVDE